MTNKHSVELGLNHLPGQYTSKVNPQLKYDNYASWHSDDAARLEGQDFIDMFWAENFEQLKDYASEPIIKILD